MASTDFSVGDVLGRAKWLAFNSEPVNSAVNATVVVNVWLLSNGFDQRGRACLCLHCSDGESVVQFFVRKRAYRKQKQIGARCKYGRADIDDSALAGSFDDDIDGGPGVV